jgi:hypothetical protein
MGTWFRSGRPDSKLAFQFLRQPFVVIVKEGNNIPLGLCRTPHTGTARSNTVRKEQANFI